MLSHYDFATENIHTSKPRIKGATLYLDIAGSHKKLEVVGGSQLYERAPSIRQVWTLVVTIFASSGQNSTCSLKPFQWVNTRKLCGYDNTSHHILFFLEWHRFYQAFQNPPHWVLKLEQLDSHLSKFFVYISQQTFSTSLSRRSKEQSHYHLSAKNSAKHSTSMLEICKKHAGANKQLLWDAYTAWPAEKCVIKHALIQERMCCRFDSVIITRVNLITWWDPDYHALLFGLFWFVWHWWSASLFVNKGYQSKLINYLIFGKV